MNSEITSTTSVRYVHYDKVIDPGMPITVGGSMLKWYNIAREGEPVPVEIETLARSFIENGAEIGRVQNIGELGFVILHRCGPDFYFLLVSSWQNANELWESVYAKTGEAEMAFSLFPLNSPHHATFCVWELAAVWHEQQAWKRFLRSDRNDSAKSTYLDDLYHGVA